MKYIVKTTEQRVVKHLRIIGSRNDQAVRLVLLDELQERVEYPPHLAHIIVAAALRANRIELVEEIDPAISLDDVEYLP